MVRAKENITEYKFHNFTDVELGKGEVLPFEFKPLLTSEQIIHKSEFQKIIKDERSFSKQNNFRISPIVEEHRGIKDQEYREEEERIEGEVKRRLQLVEEEGFRAGFEEGVKQGREEIFSQMAQAVDLKLENFSQMITDVLKTQEEILANQKKEVYQLLKNLSKWIVLRELKEDGKYIERVLERILAEIQDRSNLLVLVNADDFSNMPEILSHVQSRLGEMKNIRVEVDSSIATKGVVIESKNGIINASMEEQFRSLDKLFEDVLE